VTFSVTFPPNKFAPSVNSRCVSLWNWKN